MKETAEVDAASGNKGPRRPLFAAGALSAADRNGRVYQLGARLREGSNVYEAIAAGVTMPLVVRLYPQAAGVGRRALSAFARDVARAAAIEHPHIGRALGAGALADGTPFVAMERLRGETLQELLERRGRLGMAEARAVILGVMAALSAAHAVGLAHGALRPGNVFVVDGDVASVKLLGFGARHLPEAKRWRWAPLARSAFSPLEDQRSLTSLTCAMLARAAPVERRAKRRARRRGPAIASALGWIMAAATMVGLAVGGWLSVQRPNAPVRTLSRAR